MAARGEMGVGVSGAGWLATLSFFTYHYTYVLNSGPRRGKYVEDFGVTEHLQFILP